MKENIMFETESNKPEIKKNAQGKLGRLASSKSGSLF